MWEQLHKQEYLDGSKIRLLEYTAKLKVPGGYIYKVIQVTSNPRVSCSMIFVPDVY